MNRRKYVILHQVLGENNSIFEIIPAPRHKGHQGIVAQREFTPVDGGAVSDNITGFDLVTHSHHRPKANASVLIGAAVLREVVLIIFNIAQLAEFRLGLRFYDDLLAVSVDHPAGVPGTNNGSGVMGDFALHAGPNQGCLGFQKRYRLTLHV